MDTCRNQAITLTVRVWPVRVLAQSRANQNRIALKIGHGLEPIGHTEEIAVDEEPKIQ